MAGGRPARSRPRASTTRATLKRTLERLVDFDRINAGTTRFSVGAVNVRTGNLVYFDTTTHTIRPEHVMASGALPPGFPAVEIEGEHYWDGGLVSNTPLQWVAESQPRATRWRSRSISGARAASFRATCWSLSPGRRKFATPAAPAPTPTSSSMSRSCGGGGGTARPAPEGPEKQSGGEAACHGGDRKVYGLVQLIYRARNYEGHSKDYEFSRLSMEEHWGAGYHDAVRTLRHPQVLERPDNHDGVRSSTFVDGRE